MSAPVGPAVAAGAAPAAGGGAAPAGASTPGGAAGATPDGTSGTGETGTATGASNAATAPANLLQAGAQDATRDRAGGSADHEHLRNAEQNIRTVHGDVVAGTKIVYLLGGGELRLEPLSPDEADEVRYAFVNPQGWDDLRTSFLANRITLLRGGAGQGRRATAIRLAQAAGCTKIYELHPQYGLDRLGQWLTDDSGASQRIESGCAFIVCDPTGMAAMRGYDLRRFGQALVMHESRLVLAVGADDALTDEDLGKYLLELAGAPPRAKIMRSHLRYRLGSETRADELLAVAEVDALVGELLADCTCAQAVRLAQILAREPAGNIDPVRVRQRWGEHDRIAFWFDGLGDATTRAFAVALAVLNGLAYDDVTYAARKLTARLDTSARLTVDASGQLSTVPVQDPFQHDRVRLLRALRAETAEEDTLEPYGRVPVTVMRYERSEYPRRVIELAWTSYQIQEVLLKWLRDLVVSGSRQVRVYAGTALGVLASLSFDHVSRTALRLWATDDDADVRNAVAYAMRQALNEPQLRPLVEALVAEWYGNRSAPNAQATAARTYGVGLGADLARALAALDRLAIVADEHYRVALAIGRSLGDLILAHEERATAEVLPLVIGWLGDHRRTEAGELAFLQLTSTLSTQVRDGGSACTWPTLLYLAHCHQALREPLVTLWRMMLDRAYLNRDAKVVLAYWAGLSEADPRPREAFVRLLRMIATDPWTRQVLRREAALWIDDDNLQPLPLTEAAVSRAIGSWEETPS